MDLTTNPGQPMRCHLVTRWGRSRAYSGVVARFDSDAALRTGRFMRWSVLATSRNLRPGALIGRYVAAGGEAGDLIGAGEGQQSIVLRPSSSARGRSSVNLAPGVKDLSIDRWRRSRESTI
jgi:hypothetical protein